MSEEQIDLLLERIDYITPERIDHLLLVLDSIYTILGFTVVIAAGSLVIYLVLKPIKIFLNGGFN